jgi:hypothetical protein
MAKIQKIRPIQCFSLFSDSVLQMDVAVGQASAG